MAVFLVHCSVVVTFCRPLIYVFLFLWLCFSCLFLKKIKSLKKIFCELPQLLTNILFSNRTLQQINCLLFFSRSTAIILKRKRRERNDRKTNGPTVRLTIKSIIRLKEENNIMRLKTLFLREEEQKLFQRNKKKQNKTKEHNKICGME